MDTENIFEVRTVTCNATASTTAIEVWRCARFSVEISSAGTGTTHAGTITMDVGNAASTWEQKATILTYSAGSAIDHFSDNLTTAARYIRFTNTRTAGAVGEVITFRVVGVMA